MGRVEMKGLDDYAFIPSCVLILEIELQPQVQHDTISWIPERKTQTTWA